MTRLFRYPLARGFLALAPLVLGGCPNLFGDYMRANPDSCVANAALCSAEEVCNEATAQCEPRNRESADLGAGPDLEGTCATSLKLCKAGEVCNFRSGVCETRTCSTDGWCIEPSGSTEDLAAVWGSGIQDIWAVGASATIL